MGLSLDKMPSGAIECSDSGSIYGLGSRFQLGGRCLVVAKHDNGIAKRIMQDQQIQADRTLARDSFIQTALREWAYARSYQNSEQRTERLELWMHDYNFHRPHSSIKLNTPTSRVELNRNDLLILHS
jgi:transposase InsO family protein